MTEPAPVPPARGLYRRMGIAAAIVAGGVLLSRVLGLVRQIVFAWLLGAGATGDEYFVAFLIPDLLNYLLAGAYMAITLIPILTRRFADGDDDDAWRAFWAVTRPLAIGITVLVIVAMPFVEPILRAIEPGFTDEQVANAARLTRIVLPAQIFFILGQLLTAVQFARERFVIPTLGPLVYNLEGVDQDLGRVLPPTTSLRPEWKSDLLGGVITLNGTWADGSPLLAIPHFARMNRMPPKDSTNRTPPSVVWIRDR